MKRHAIDIIRSLRSALGLDSGLVSVVVVLILALGLTIRVAHYLDNRSLWVDEAMLALNILNRGFGGLFGPLDDNQGAPVLFLMIEKAMVVVFGPAEPALRLFPLCSSAVALIVFFVVGRRLLARPLVLAALFICAVSYPLVYYAQEVKQYSVDVAVTLVLIHLFDRCMPLNTAPARRMWVLGLAGVVAVWLSLPAVFILAGIALALLLRCLSMRACRWRRLAGMFAAWAASAIVHHVVILEELASNQHLLNYWQRAFMPLPTGLDEIRAGYAIIGRFFQYAGFPAPARELVLTLCLVAAIEIITRRRYERLTLLVPFACLVVASSMGKYPFEDRLALFAVPVLYLLVTYGVEVLTRNRGAAITGVLCAIVVWPFAAHMDSVVTRQPLFVDRRGGGEETKPLLSYLLEHQEDGDIVYIYYGAVAAARYYQQVMELDDTNWVYGTGARTRPHLYVEQIRAVAQHPRVWFLFVHKHGREERLFLDSIAGRRLDESHAPGGSLYLYAFDPGRAQGATR